MKIAAHDIALIVTDSQNDVFSTAEAVKAMEAGCVTNPPAQQGGSQ